MTTTPTTQTRTSTSTQTGTSPRTRAVRLAAVVVASASMFALAGPAQASGGNDVVRRGNCSGATDWKLKLGPDNGKIEVEGEIDSNHVGQTWRWRLLHDGSTVARGTRTTQAPSGSFTVRRVVGNRAGTDHLTLRARNVKSNELCVARASL